MSGIRIKPHAQRATRDPRLLCRVFSGTDIDMAHPSPADVRFEDVAHHLAGISRFNNATSKRYSVAQHLVLGTKFCSPRAQPFFAVHDAQEYIVGDDVTPKKRARIVCMLERLAGHPAFTAEDLRKFELAIERGEDEFELRHSEAVTRAAGLKWPVPADIEREVKIADRSMLLTEWRELMRGPPPPAPKGFEGVGAFPCSIGKVWDFERAREELMQLFQRVFPCYAGDHA